MDGSLLLDHLISTVGLLWLVLIQALLTSVESLTRLVAGAGNRPLQQSSDALAMLLFPIGKALPAEV